MQFKNFRISVSFQMVFSMRSIVKKKYIYIYTRAHILIMFHDYACTYAYFFYSCTFLFTLNILCANKCTLWRLKGCCLEEKPAGGGREPLCFFSSPRII